VFLKFAKGNHPVNRDRIAHDMQVVFLKVDDLTACVVENEGVAYIPFLGHGPVQNLGARGNLLYVKGYVPLYDFQGPAHAVAGDAPAQREQFRQQGMHVMPAVAEILFRGMSMLFLFDHIFYITR